MAGPRLLRTAGRRGIARRPAGAGAGARRGPVGARHRHRLWRARQALSRASPDVCGRSRLLACGRVRSERVSLELPAGLCTARTGQTCRGGSLVPQSAVDRPELLGRGVQACAKRAQRWSRIGSEKKSCVIAEPPAGAYRRAGRSCPDRDQAARLPAGDRAVGQGLAPEPGGEPVALPTGPGAQASRPDGGGEKTAGAGRADAATRCRPGAGGRGVVVAQQSALPRTRSRAVACGQGFHGGGRNRKSAGIEPGRCLCAGHAGPGLATGRPHRRSGNRP